MALFSLFPIKPIAKQITVQPQQRGVKVSKGKYIGTVQSGAYWIWRWEDIFVTDIRERFETIPAQEMITLDGISIKLTLSISYRVTDLELALYKSSQNFQNALFALSQTIARDSVGTMTLEDFLTNRSEINTHLFQKMVEEALNIGITVTRASIRDTILSGDIKRAMAQVVAAKYEAIAKLERARGESATLRHLANAAKIVDDNPTIYQLRLLDAVSQGTGNTIVLGQTNLPIVTKK